MIVRLGYVAMSVHLKNASPSQTMTYTQFQKLNDREAGIKKLERISTSNLQNCLRLLKHNKGHDISFFRFSSKLIPLANHEDLQGWNFIRPIRPHLAEIGKYVADNNMRVDFHPDHFVILNSPDQDILKTSLKTLRMHEMLLKGMNIPPTHRCVLHVGGGYKDKEQALERFIYNWGFIPTSIQRMLMLENDDKTFTIGDTLYLGEKLAIPVVFDYHHHLVNAGDWSWKEQWQRVVHTWEDSPLPIKMHISSPRDEKDRRAHADYIDIDMFMTFLREIKGSVTQIDCMIEAKRKDDALFQLMQELKNVDGIEYIDGASFYLK
ncbi:UV DNA damage repair endonuclease UvsE [Priestia taiwanensis]|uniref:UV damage endonuclease UvsE n=1 Tax=Priestia taiwanensis TaxID=1347902 RepID=A0A917AWX3_9BACI|nr:UV DNA damage repair endonuclease UvsE [Priestia taiwanensis]MBM7365232.1 UV damage endonuclease UvdE [Priestia taiwanensis]GGE85544.1 UV damage endonuclease UvsE [Priestia taiwanensis]